jgi:2-haloacid dehalogenase
MDDMVAALMLDFYGTVVHEDVAILTAICAQVASTLTAPVPPGDIARQWSGWFADECASSAGRAFKSQHDTVRASLARLLDALGSPEDPDQLTLAQFAYWRRPPLFEDAREATPSRSMTSLEVIHGHWRMAIPRWPLSRN